MIEDESAEEILGSSMVPDQLITWVACECYVWPVVSIYQVGRCGLCGTRPTRPMPEPLDRKAYAL